VAANFMSETKSERTIAGILVFGALFLAIMSPSRWHDSGHGWPAAKTTGNYWVDVAEPREREILFRHPDILVREGLTLTVRLADGNEKTYIDDPAAHDLQCGQDGSGSDACIKYHAWEVSPDQRYITLAVGFYEGGGALLIDRDAGSDLGLDATPHLSPDGRHWALVDDDDAYGSGMLAVLFNEAAGPRITASEIRDYCAFEAWETKSTFLIACYNFDARQSEEFRVTWDQAGALTVTPTGKIDPAVP
jgi:hypothetical protein